MMKLDILERDLNGESIPNRGEEFQVIQEIINNAQKIIAKMNTKYCTNEEVKEIFAELTGKPAPEGLWIMPPFYTDFGRNINIGKNVFINHGCEFMDRGGITIEDNVFIGPKVNLISLNHHIKPSERHITISKPIVIKRNAWIGVGATIMSGITIGENSIVSAGAVVTKDVAANTIVAGVPAKVIKKIEE